MEIRYFDKSLINSDKIKLLLPNLKSPFGYNEFITFKSPDVAYENGIQSCLVLVLYQPEIEEGILAHLSTHNLSGLGSICAQDALETLKYEVGYKAPKLSTLEDLEAYLIGEMDKDKRKSVLVKKQLEENKIPIVYEDLGGNLEREVYFIPERNVVYISKFER